MKFEYSPPGLAKDFENEKYLKKKYGINILNGWICFVNVLEAADNAYDIKAMPMFYMEHKKNNLKDYYAVSLDKKKSKWRLMLQMLDENDNVLIPTENEKDFLKKVKKIRIRGLSDHYDEY